MRDVAAAAGVSVATASRVLGGGGRRVVPENARRVLEAAVALRYTMDAAARAMSRGTDAIALIVDDLSTAPVAAVVAAMERQARTVDAFVTITSTRGTPERQVTAVRTLGGFRPRALVLTTSRINATQPHTRLLEELTAYERNGGRVVIYGSVDLPPDLPFDSISVDDRASARAMGEYVGGSGHRRPVILAGTRQRSFAAARTSGFVEGMLATGVDVQDIRILNCEVSRAGGFDAARALIDEGLDDRDVIVAVNDVVAVGALAACRAAGVAVPDQISVTGFDDIPLARDLMPGLTTMVLPFAEIGLRAIQMAVTEPRRIREWVTGSLVIRGSTTTRPT
ncbi:LacI family DNA-binding transcriptional regulator [Actinoplanes sp. NPDC051851]|uniref:LacI family DNA-binding transcriptional regulator n=1 Tax=Actinoplanes sp. NPDC051851 TaxID=3154753 RepID=UPI003416D947